MKKLSALGILFAVGCGGPSVTEVCEAFACLPSEQTVAQCVESGQRTLDRAIAQGCEDEFNAANQCAIDSLDATSCDTSEALARCADLSAAYETCMGSE